MIYNLFGRYYLRAGSETADVNSIKCPQCGVVNWATATHCIRCRTPFEHLPPSAYVSIPASEQAQAHTIPFINRPIFIPDPELQRKVWMWYVIYCVLMTLLYLSLAVVGAAMLLIGPQDLEMDAMEAQIQGIIFLVMGIILTIPFAIAPFLPKKSGSWVFGLVLLIIGSTGGCLCWPITLPLLVQWLKLDIKQMFGKM